MCNSLVSKTNVNGPGESLHHLFSRKCGLMAKLGQLYYFLKQNSQIILIFRKETKHSYSEDQRPLQGSIVKN